MEATSPWSTPSKSEFNNKEGLLEVKESMLFEEDDDGGGPISIIERELGDGEASKEEQTTDETLALVTDSKGSIALITELDVMSEQVQQHGITEDACTPTLENNSGDNIGYSELSQRAKGKKRSSVYPGKDASADTPHAQRRAPDPGVRRRKPVKGPRMTMSRSHSVGQGPEPLQSLDSPLKHSKSTSNVSGMTTMTDDKRKGDLEASPRKGRRLSEHQRALRRKPRRAPPPQSTLMGNGSLASSSDGLRSESTSTTTSVHQPTPNASTTAPVQQSIDAPETENSIELARPVRRSPSPTWSPLKGKRRPRDIIELPPLYQSIRSDDIKYWYRELTNTGKIDLDTKKNERLKEFHFTNALALKANQIAKQGLLNRNVLFGFACYISEYKVPPEELKKASNSFFKFARQLTLIRDNIATEEQKHGFDLEECSWVPPGWDPKPIPRPGTAKPKDPEEYDFQDEEIAKDYRNLWEKYQELMALKNPADVGAGDGPEGVNAAAVAAAEAEIQQLSTVDPQGKSSPTKGKKKNNRRSIRKR